MPKQFFIIPLANNPDLIALQDWLKTNLPETAVYQDPAGFHITLVVTDDPGEQDLTQITVPTNLPAFGLGGDWLQRFDTPDGYVIALGISGSAQLTYLQAALFYELRARGLALSTFSWPGLYQPHVTLATLPTEPGYYSVPQMVHFQVDRFALESEGYQELATFPLLTGPNGGPVQEMIHSQDVMVVWELRGSYPDVPIAADVDYDTLIAGDSEPVFVTLPVGKAGATSGNHRHYDDGFVQELERQLLARKPVGLMGHLKEEDRATEFPPEAVHWVGARRVGELLWGKGYVPPGEARDRIRRYKAQNKKIATSIDAYLEGVWDQEISAYRVIADTLELNQIDIAPADRAGIPDLAAVPHLTTEMTGSTPPEHKEQDMDKDEVIREMTADDAKRLPVAVRQAVMAEAPEAQTVREMRQALGLPENADMLAAVKQMKTDADQRQQDAVEAHIKELVEDPEKGVKLVSMRGVVTELVKARKPQTPEEAEKVFGEVVASESIKGALQETVQTTMGPAVRRPVAGQNEQPKFFKIPAKEEAK